MKKGLNKAVKAQNAVDEIFLFHAMANEFNNSTFAKSTYVKEIHGNASHVEFSSNYKKGGVAVTELGDLLIFTFDKATKELRICIMQAKYKKQKYLNFLHFTANIFQWELLYNKPQITSKGSIPFPCNILNFQNAYKSISAYGIFYRDNVSGDVDFLYTIPENLKPYKFPLNRIKQGDRKFIFSCPHNLGSPNILCNKGMTPKETISTCSIDVFEDQVLQCRIGVPVNDNYSMMDWTLETLTKMKDRADDPRVISEVLEYFNNHMNERPHSFEDTPAALVVITDSRKCNAPMGYRTQDTERIQRA